MSKCWDMSTKRAPYLEGVNSHVDEGLEFVLVPLAGVRVGEVDEAHSRLLHRYWLASEKTVTLSIWHTQKSYCQTLPSDFLMKYPFSAASSKIALSWAMYGLIQTQIYGIGTHHPLAFTEPTPDNNYGAALTWIPRSLILANCPFASGK